MHFYEPDMSLDGDYSFVSDLGLDKIVCYKFDKQQQRLSINISPNTEVAVGTDPQHLTFYPNKNYMVPTVVIIVF